VSKILLINPSYNYPTKSEMAPSGALLLLGTLLKTKGHSIKIIHMVSDHYTPEELGWEVRKTGPDIVGITMSTFQTRSTREIVKVIQKVRSNTKIIIGGSHPSSVGSSLSGYSNVQFVFGEGENTLLDLVEPGHKAFTLDDIPLPDLSLIDIKKYTGCVPYGPTPSISTMFSRGCPFKCSFCNKAIFGNTMRFRRVEACLDELEHLGKYGIKEVSIRDDTFNLNRQWCEDILHGIIGRGLNKKMVFRTSCRANRNLMDKDLLKLMKEAGIWIIFYGVESGNQEMLDKMGKSLTLEEIERAFKLTREVGVKTEASFIVGLPGETLKTFKDSLDFCKKIKPFWVGFSSLTPFPGTPVTEELEASGCLLNKDYDNYLPGKIVSRTEALTASDIQKYTKQAERLSRVIEIKNLLLEPIMAYRMLKGVIGC